MWSFTDLICNFFTHKDFLPPADQLPGTLFTPLHFVASDGYAHYMRDTLSEMDEELFEDYLRYHFATCERPDMLGYSNHYLDIFQKNR